MAFVKGQSGNPGGRTKAQIASQRELARLGPRAIARLGRLLDSDNEAIAMSAVKEVLDRNLGKARQQATLDVTHDIGPNAAHALAHNQIKALTELGLDPDDNAKSLISLPNLTADNKLSVNHATIEDAEAIEITPETKD